MKKLIRVALYLVSVMLALPVAAQLDINHRMSPETTAPGAPVAVIYEISNQAPADAAITDFSFTNTLPVIPGALQALNAVSNSCDGQLTVTGPQISYTGGRLAIGESCSIRVLVVTDVPGSYSSELSAVSVSYDGGAPQILVEPFAADLTVDDTEGVLTLSATPDDPGLGEVSRVAMHFDIPLNGSASINMYGFSYRLPEELTLASPSELSQDCPFTFTQKNQSTLTSQWFSSTAGVDCEIAFNVVARHPGVFPLYRAGANTTGSTFSYDRDGGPQIELPVKPDQLQVSPEPLHLDAQISPNPAIPGGKANLVYTLTNTNRQSSASNVAFSQVLGNVVAGLSTASLVRNTCAATVGTGGTVSVSNARIPKGGQCEIELQVDLPNTVGIFSGSTSSVTAQVAGQPVVASAAGIRLGLGGSLVKSWSAPVVAAGDSVDLTFTLFNGDPNNAISNLNFKEFVPGLEFDEIKVADDCDGGTIHELEGLVWSINGTGIGIPAGDSCQVVVQFTVPATARNGRYESGTDFAYEVNGDQQSDLTVVSDAFNILSGPPVLMALSPDSVQPGDSLVVDITLGNGDASAAIDQDVKPGYSNISALFDSAVPEVAAAVTGLPVNPCGAGSSLVDTVDGLALQGGNLAEGESCHFELAVEVAPDATPGKVMLALDPITATPLGTGIETTTRAETELSVVQLVADMAFYPLPATPGNEQLGYAVPIDNTQVGLQYQLENLGDEALDITFYTLRPSEGLPGSAISALPADGFCGVSSSVSATNVLVFQSLTLAPGTSCTFDMTLELPLNPQPARYNFLTSNIVYTSDGSQLQADPIVATLELYDDTLPRDLTRSNLNEDDPDGDGILTVDEELAGDVNGDGIADALQATVASRISSVTGRPVSLSFSEGCTLGHFYMVAADTGENGQSIPDGLADFELNCSESLVTLYLPGGTPPDDGVPSVMKFGPMAPNFGDAPQFYDFPALLAPDGEALSFMLSDGELGDSTPVDGRLVDPIGVIWAVLVDAINPRSGPNQGPTGQAVALPEVVPAMPLWALLVTGLGLLGLSRRFRK
jgi:hypothetical protein